MSSKSLFRKVNVHLLNGKLIIKLYEHHKEYNKIILNPTYNPKNP